MPNPFRIDISDNASTTDTVDAIIKVINERYKNGFIPDFARKLRAGTNSDSEFIKKLFDLVCKYVQYQRDPPGWERIYTPEKLFREGKGDCKKMTTAIASTLKAAGIEPLLKVISYDGENWAHIYPICKINHSYYVLDPVNFKKFNEEIPHKKSLIYNLNGKNMPSKLSYLGSNRPIINGLKHSLSELNGDLTVFKSKLDNTHELINFLNDEASKLEGMGGFLDKLKTGLSNVVSKVGNAIQNAADSIKDGAATVALAPVRGAFLGLLLLGKALEKTPLKMNLADKLAAQWKKDNGAKLSAMWDKMGGKPSELKQTIAKASGQGLGYRYDPATQTIHIDGIGAVTLATAAAALALATPILLEVTKILKDAGIIKEGSPEIKNATTTILAAGAALTNGGKIPTQMANDLQNFTDANGDNIKAAGIDFSSPWNIFAKSILLMLSGSLIDNTFISISVIIIASTSLFYSLFKIYNYENKLEKCR